MSKLNKKGEGSTTTTIVVIVLAIIVLVVLVMGFTGTWRGAWEKMTGFAGSGPNIDSVVQACQIACSTNSKYDYCEKIRNIRIYDTNQEIKTAKLSCSDLVEGGRRGQILDESGTATLALSPIDIECDMDCPKTEKKESQPVATTGKTCEDLKKEACAKISVDCFGGWEREEVVAGWEDLYKVVEDLTDKVSPEEAKDHPGEKCIVRHD